MFIKLQWLQSQDCGGGHSCHSPYHLFTQKTGMNEASWYFHRSLDQIFAKNQQITSDPSRFFASRENRMVSVVSLNGNSFSLFSSKSIKSMAEKDRLCGYVLDCRFRPDIITLRDFGWQWRNGGIQWIRINSLGCKSTFSNSRKVPETLWPFGSPWFSRFD